jgi:phosphatidylserine/phosphatidylglycerophosphate/cardiolipin synthase-like enzyme
MLSYPRPAVEKYRPVPPYHQPVLPTGVIGLAGIGLVTAVVFLSGWRNTTAASLPGKQAPAEVAVAPPPRPPAALPPVIVAKAAVADETPSSPFLFSGEAGVTVDFAPRTTQERLPVHLIRTATKNVKLQSYDLSAPAVKVAVNEALDRDVTVDIMVDQPMYVANKTSLDALKRSGARVWINARSGHAHDKTIIADDARVLIGSINYSRGRKDVDLANTVLIENPEITKVYLDHWAQHAGASAAK